MKTALVLGAGGFIGSHLVNRLRAEGYWVRGVDLKYPEFGDSQANEFILADLRNPSKVSQVMFGPSQFSETDSINSFDEVYALAADMGGAGYLFIGDNDYNVIHNNTLININVADQAIKKSVKKLFYSSSACVYPERNQLDPQNPNCIETSVHPASPDSIYGWEKLYSEKIYHQAYVHSNLDVRIARFHNIFGPHGTYEGGREKAPAAICRKVIEAENESDIEIWGDGKQTRTFLYIDECIEAVRRFMLSDVPYIFNIGSEKLISINELAQLVIDMSGKDLKIKNVKGPQGVRGRSSNNEFYRKCIGWSVPDNFEEGLVKTYTWIFERINSRK